MKKRTSSKAIAAFCIAATTIFATSCAASDTQEDAPMLVKVTTATLTVPSPTGMIEDQISENEPKRDFQIAEAQNARFSEWLDSHPWEDNGAIKVAEKTWYSGLKPIAPLDGRPSELDSGYDISTDCSASYICIASIKYETATIDVYSGIVDEKVPKTLILDSRGGSTELFGCFDGATSSSINVRDFKGGLRYEVTLTKYGLQVLTTK